MVGLFIGAARAIKDADGERRYAHKAIAKYYYLQDGVYKYADKRETLYILSRILMGEYYYEKKVVI